MESFSHKELYPGLHVILCPGELPGPGRLPGWGRVQVVLITGNEKALLFDTGFGNADLKSYVEGITKLPIIVVNSHAHLDHNGGNPQFDEVWIGEHEISNLEPIYIKDADTPHPNCDIVKNSKGYCFRTLADGDIIELGNRRVKVIEISGHTKGSIALLDEKTGILLSGDAILKRVLLIGGVSIKTYSEALIRTDKLDFKDILGAHWPEPLGRDFIKKVVKLLDEFDHEKSEEAGWSIPGAPPALRMFAHGNAFEDKDFCAVGYRPQDLPILTAKDIK